MLSKRLKSEQLSLVKQRQQSAGMFVGGKVMVLARA